MPVEILVEKGRTVIRTSPAMKRLGLDDREIAPGTPITVESEIAKARRVFSKAEG